MMSRTAQPSPDEQAIGVLAGVLEVHRNTTSWYNNASFALPLAAMLVVFLTGLVLRRRDILAFAAFLAFVTTCMVPVVLVSWRRTATAVVLTTEGITSLHQGRVLKALPWDEVQAVTRRETQGNVRWIVFSASDERIALDGELENLPALIGAVRRLAGLADEAAG